jgi:acetoacetyl-CoA synthetase
VSPDTGVTAVLERLVQIEPAVLFVDNAVYYNGKVHSSHQKSVDIVKGLTNLKAVVMFETIKGYQMDISGLDAGKRKAWTYDDFVNR